MNEIKFTLRLNEEDRLKLKMQSNELKISQAELLRELIRKNMYEDVRSLNESFNDIRKLLRNLSNNINQVAKKINSQILIDELEEAKKIHKEIEEIWRLLRW